MKSLLRILLIFIILMALVALVGFFLPSKIHIERSRIMSEPAEVVFGQINTLPNWEKWSPWHRLDKNMKITYGKMTGTGATYSWTSTNRRVGTGSLTITESKPYEMIRMELVFMQQPPVDSKFYFAKNDKGLNLHWTMEVKMGNNPFARYMGLFMDKRVGRDFEEGLVRLDSASKMAEKEGENIKIEEKDFPGFSYVYILYDKIKPAELGSTMSEAYNLLYGYIPESGLQITGGPFALYRSFSKDAVTYEAGVPVSGPMKAMGRIKTGKLDPCKTVVGYYYGSYEKMEPAYEKIQKWAADKGIAFKEYMWEIYMTDPKAEPDTSKWLTEIYFPVK